MTSERNEGLLFLVKLGFFSILFLIIIVLILDKFEDTLSTIEDKLYSLINSERKNGDKLVIAQNSIEELSNLYKFKKTIERDLRKETIIKRFVDVLYHEIGLKQFVIFEDKTLQKKRSVLYMTDGFKDNVCEIPNFKANCRAQRTNSIVMSNDFRNLCEDCDIKNKYVCIPFHIDEETALTIKIVPKNEEDYSISKDSVNKVLRYLEELKPILQSKILHEVLKERNFVDSLTGMYNRKYLEEYIDKNILNRKENETFSILMLDIDYFKMVNDTYGHDTGDDIIKSLSKIMLDFSRDKGVAIRYGGEEFIIILENMNEKDTLELAENIRNDFGNIKHKYNGETFNKTLSIGVSMLPKDTEQIWKSIKFADLALYEAKNGGRNRVVRFEEKREEGRQYSDY